MLEAGIDELAAMLMRLAPRPGSLASALPEVWFFRVDRPTPPSRARTSHLSVVVAIRGSKRIRMGGLALTYDPQHYIVLRGETEFESEVIDASPERPYLAIKLQLPAELVMNLLLDLDAGRENGEGMDDARDRASRGPTSSHSLASHTPSSSMPASRALDSIVTPSAPDAPAAFLSRVDDRLVDALLRLVRALEDPAERRVLAPLVIREITFRLLRTDAAAVLRDAASRLGDRGRIRDAMAFIDTHAARHLSVTAIARHVGMSPSHFAHRFREVASVSPMQYLKHVRLDRARTLLLGEGRSSGEIAIRVGYESISHFTRDFKRQFGFTPARYARAFEQEGMVPVPLSARETTVA